MKNSISDKMKQLQKCRAQGMGDDTIMALMKDEGMDDDTIMALMEYEKTTRKIRNSIDWWEVFPVVYAVLLIGSVMVGIATHSQIAWGIFWSMFLFGIVVWIFQVFFGALGILGGIFRLIGK